MKFLLIILSSFFLVPGSCFTQANVGINIDSDLSVNNLEAYSVGTFDTRSTKYEGSPLIWEDWLLGKVRLKDTEVFTDKDYKFAYDGLKHILFIELGQDKYSLYLSQIDELRLFMPSGKESTFFMFKDEKGIPKLFKQLSEGKYALFSNTDVVVGKPTYNAALDVGSLRPRLIKVENMYLRYKGKMYQISGSRRSFLREYRSEKDLNELLKYFKKKRINTKNESEIIEALSELNKNN